MVRSRDDRGAVLVIALVFMVAGTLLATALITQASDNLTNTSNYQSLRAVNYSADGAMEGAIQQVRYHGPCENFPKGSSSLQLTSSRYVFVACVNTPLPVLSATANGNALTTSALSPFLPAYAISGQPVVDPVTGQVKGSVNAVTGPTTATMNGSFSGSVYFDTFYACTSTSSISSCPAGSAEITAYVLFDDVNTSLNPPAATGYAATVELWVVRDANA
jgi:hypothetical protein